MADDNSAVASATGTLNKNGTTRMNINASPGPEVEIIASKPKGPPAQYA
jgi:hypothetical protein